MFRKIKLNCIKVKLDKSCDTLLRNFLSLNSVVQNINFDFKFYFIDFFPLSTDKFPLNKLLQAIKKSVQILTLKAFYLNKTF